MSKKFNLLLDLFINECVGTNWQYCTFKWGANKNK